MGVNLTPIIPRKKISLKCLRGKIIAFDALNVIYQFLSLIRLPYGEPLRDGSGRITSHLVGIVNRYTRLIVDYEIKPIFVFDGLSHPLKKKEILKRRKLREKSFREWQEALQRGDFEKAFSKAVTALKLEDYMIDDTKRLLSYMGIPYVDAPYDAEAQAAYIVSRGDAWSVGTMDYDTLLYGAPRMTRYITLTGFEWLPSKGIARRLIPELILLDETLNFLKINRKQLIDIAILIGTDYNEGIKGIGPKKALKLIKIYGSLERLPKDIYEKLPHNYEEIRKIFLFPEVKKDYSIEFRKPDFNKLKSFLVEERDFSEKRVNNIIRRLEKVSWYFIQRDISKYFDKEK